MKGVHAPLCGTLRTAYRGVSFRDSTPSTTRIRACRLPMSRTRSRNTVARAIGASDGRKGGRGNRKRQSKGCVDLHGVVRWQRFTADLFVLANAKAGAVERLSLSVKFLFMGES